MTSIQETGFFLVQSSGDLSHHLTKRYDDRTFAEDLIEHGYYRNDNWEIKKRDSDFRYVRPGDWLIQYCTGTVEQSPRRIRFIYSVEAVERIPEKEIESAVEDGLIDAKDGKRLGSLPHILRLRKESGLAGGVHLATIRDAVNQGVLSEAMGNCGRLGFNIARVQPEDLEKLREFSGAMKEDLAVYSGYEEDLRQYIVGKENAGVLSSDLLGFHIHQDEQGKSGELYRTPVGEIDILYRNAEGDYLVVELKATEEESDKVVGQIARYMGWVEDNLARGRTVSGAIVAQSHGSRLKYAARAIRNCRLLSFRVEFNFTEEE